jgi:hypothetical protein
MPGSYSGLFIGSSQEEMRMPPIETSEGGVFNNAAMTLQAGGVFLRRLRPCKPCPSARRFFVAN